MTFESGERIGEYKLVEKLGEGAFGEVWKAEHNLTGEQFALKIFTSENAVSCLRREAKMLLKVRQVNHPNIVTVHGGDDTQESPYIVMELIEGVSLSDLIKRKAKLPVDSALKIFKRIVSGVAFAHANNLVHRDLKPSNILIGMDRAKNKIIVDKVKVCDFGLGISIDKESLSMSLKSDDAKIAGTLDYMSPEQLRGEKVDRRSDIYSLGLIFFKMLSGKLPSGMYDKIKSYKFAPYAADLDRIIERCCAPLDKRYSDAGELLRHLEGFQIVYNQYVEKERQLKKEEEQKRLNLERAEQQRQEPESREPTAAQSASARIAQQVSGYGKRLLQIIGLILIGIHFIGMPVSCIYFNYREMKKVGFWKGLFWRDVSPWKIALWEISIPLDIMRAKHTEIDSEMVAFLEAYVDWGEEEKAFLDGWQEKVKLERLPDKDIGLYLNKLSDYMLERDIKIKKEFVKDMEAVSGLFIDFFEELILCTKYSCEQRRAVVTEKLDKLAAQMKTSPLAIGIFGKTDWKEARKSLEETDWETESEGFNEEVFDGIKHVIQNMRRNNKRFFDAFYEMAE